MFTTCYNELCMSTVCTVAQLIYFYLSINYILCAVYGMTINFCIEFCWFIALKFLYTITTCMGMGMGIPLVLYQFSLIAYHVKHYFRYQIVLCRCLKSTMSLIDSVFVFVLVFVCVCWHEMPVHLSIYIKLHATMHKIRIE